jgi:glycosyltransferase involved in cell wall biosynthesis
MKLSIIMPVFNEADTIAEIIAKVRSVPLPQYELVLVNDASTDGSGKILDSYASQPNTRVLHHPVNRGKGAALATGLQGASGEVAVIQDADMEYDPFDLLRMLALVEQGAQVVFGVRNLASQKAMMRWGNHFLSFLTSVLYGARVRDMETCYKMMTRPVFSKLQLECRRFDVEAEITAKIMRAGYKIQEMPITYNARYENKKLSPLDGIPTLRALLKYRFGKQPATTSTATAEIAQ